MLPTLFKKVQSDIAFRIRFFLSLSLLFNFAYALFLFIISRVYGSRWFFVISIYYGLLSTARIFIFSQIDSKKPLYKRILLMRACGYFLFLLNLVVSVMMFLLIYTSPPVKHHEITVIALAAYTFSALTIAIVGGVKHFRRDNHVYSCVKIISLISASVSVVTLTNTMLVTFGEETMLLRRIILPILSGVIAIFIILCALQMILKANTDLRILENEKERK